MKIIIPVTDNNDSEEVCESFGRAPYFLIYDHKEKLVIENIAAKSSGGAGIKAAQIVIDEGVDGVICYRLGKNAADLLKETNITIYKGIQGTSTENIKLLEEKKLEVLKDFHSGFHNIG